MPATLFPTTLKREVTARLPAFGSLKHSSSDIKRVVCSQFQFLSVLPKVSTDLHFTFYCEKNPKGSHLSALIHALWKTDNFSRTDTGASTVSFCSHKATVFRKSKALVISWRRSDAQKFCDPYIMSLGIPSIILLHDVLQEALQQMLKKS